MKMTFWVFKSDGRAFRVWTPLTSKTQLTFCSKIKAEPYSDWLFKTMYCGTVNVDGFYRCLYHQKCHFLPKTSTLLLLSTRNCLNDHLGWNSTMYVAPLFVIKRSLWTKATIGLLCIATSKVTWLASCAGKTHALLVSWKDDIFSVFGYSSLDSCSGLLAQSNSFVTLKKDNVAFVCSVEKRSDIVVCISSHVRRLCPRYIVRW